MELYKMRIVDELFRISIPSDLRKELDINTRDKISLTTIGTIVILMKAESDAVTDVEAGVYICETNELGMIILPQEVRTFLDCKVADRLPLYLTDSLMILKSAVKK